MVVLSVTEKNDKGEEIFGSYTHIPKNEGAAK